MRPIFLLAQRELAAYFNTGLGYAILAAVLAIDGVFYNALAIGNTPRYSSDVLELFFFYAGGVAMVAGIVLTMRLLAEERQTGTLVLLETAPITERQIVLGKYLGALGFLTLISALTLYMPALIFVNGKVSWAQIGAGYLGMFAAGAASVAIGTFGSAVARNQLIAIAVSGVILLLLVVSWWIAKIADPPLADVISYSAFFDRHFLSFTRGRINTESLVFYGSVTFVFLMLSVRTLQARRWE